MENVFFLSDFFLYCNLVEHPHLINWHGKKLNWVKMYVKYPFVICLLHHKCVFAQTLSGMWSKQRK